MPTKNIIASYASAKEADTTNSATQAAVGDEIIDGTLTVNGMSMLNGTRFNTVSYVTETNSSVTNFTPIYTQEVNTYNVNGPGWNLGNAGGWTVSILLNSNANFSQRGISQLISGTLTKHAIGDTSGCYIYNNTDGGACAQSDEGSNGATFQLSENSGHFDGVVASSTGLGDTKPSLSFVSGNNWLTDGSFLINRSRDVLSGFFNGASTPLGLSFLNKLPVTGVTLPLSTAWGTVVGGIDDPAVSADSSKSVVLSVTLGNIGGSTPALTAGIVTIAGINYPEQAIITAVETPVGGVQSITISIRNPNSQALIFQGGIQGNFLTFDSDYDFNGALAPYYAFGSLTGSDLIYGWNIAGNLAGSILPMNPGYQKATNSGVDAGFTLYPGAEVVSNNSATEPLDITLEPNRVTWTEGDHVECPHHPTFGGNSLFVTRTQNTYTNGAVGSQCVSLDYNGKGINGLFKGIGIRNSSAASQYLRNAGPLNEPTAIYIQGLHGHTIYQSDSPPTGSAILFVQGSENAPVDQPFDVVNIDFSRNGRIVYDPSALTGQGQYNISQLFAGGLEMYVGGTQANPTWQNGTLATNVVNATDHFQINGENGFTGDQQLSTPIGTCTLHIAGGIITSITTP